MKTVATLFAIATFYISFGQCSGGIGQQDPWDIDPSCAWGWVSINSSTYNETCPGGDGYVLALNDDFNGSSINSSIWRTLLYGSIHALGGNLHSSGGGEYQYYSPNNLEVSNGTLKIYSKTEFVDNGYIDDNLASYPANYVYNDGITNLRDFYYTSGCLHSLQKFPAGKYEIRCKMPANDCLWPAFWLRWDGWYNFNQEIDIPDYYRESSLADPLSFHCNMGRNSCGANRVYNCSSVGLEDDWHTMSVEWDPYFVTFMLDEQVLYEVHTLYNAAGQIVPPCDYTLATGNYLMCHSRPLFTNMHVLVNSAVRFPDMAQHGDDPATMEIDYIKGYVKLDCGKVVDVCNWNPDRHASSNIVDNIEDPTVYTGHTVNLAGNPSSCNVTVANGQFLNAYASEKVVMKNGFTATSGSAFRATIVPCSELLPLAKTNSSAMQVNETQAFQESQNISLELSKLIKVYDLLGRELVNLHGETYHSAYDKLYPGVYQLVYQVNEKFYSKKIVKPFN